MSKEYTPTRQTATQPIQQAWGPITGSYWSAAPQPVPLTRTNGYVRPVGAPSKRKSRKASRKHRKSRKNRR
jgi:hypothetical protein